MTIATTDTMETPDNVTPIRAELAPKQLMRVTLSKEQLDAALTQCVRAVSAKYSLPVLGNVLLRVDADGLHVAATNLEVGVLVTIPMVTVEDEYGAVTIPGKRILEFVRALNKGDTVTIKQTDGKTARIEGKTSKTRATMIGMEASEFPDVPTYPESTKTVVVPVARLREMWQFVGFAAAKDDARPVFTGMYFERGGADGALDVSDEEYDKLHVAAADSFRLSVYGTDAVFGTDETFKFLVPATSVKVAAECFAKSEGDVTIRLSPNGHQVAFECGDTTVASNLLQGQFPRYQAIIPKSHTTSAVYVRPDMLTAFKRAMMFAKNGANVVKVTVRPDGTTTLNATDDDLGDTEQDVTALLVAYAPHHLPFEETVLNDDGEIDDIVRHAGDPERMPETVTHYNGDYFKQFLTLMETGCIEYCFRNGGHPDNPLSAKTQQPATLRPVADTDTPLPYDLTYVVMPMHSTR